VKTLADLELLPEVRTFFDEGALAGWVDGEPFASSAGETFATCDPGTGRKIAEVHELSADEVDRAVGVAGRAFEKGPWAKMPTEERAAILHRFADLVQERLPIIAQIEAVDSGKIYGQAKGDVLHFILTIRYFADLAKEVPRRSALPNVRGFEAWTVRQPWGPCGVIVPWNFSLLLISWGIAPALAAGNTVVIKPAEDTPLSALYMARLAKEAGIPDGVINVVTGRGETTGAALASHPGLRRMSFTGSPEVGRLIAQSCGKNLVPVKLELGGKGAAIVFDDVDVSRTVQSLTAAITFHAGQICCNATRWIVQRKIYDAFVAEAVERLSRVTVGHELDAKTEMGPLISNTQQQRVFGYLERGRAEGAEVLLEGGCRRDGRSDCEGGHYVLPALLAGSLDNVVAREEVFGPVAYLAPFDTEEEAIRMTNATDYGLANSVWANDPTRAERVAEALEAGNSWINCHNVFPHGVPYAGIKKSGMGGGVLSPETLYDYWRNTSVVRPV